MNELSSNGITAWIQVNERKLECYSTSADKLAPGDVPVMKCWIASQAGETFAVVLSTPRKTLADDYLAVLKIDGHRLSDRIISRRDESDITFWNGAREGDLRRPFVFSVLSVTDDDSMLNSLDNVRNSSIGEIEIQIYRITGLHDVIAPTVKQRTLPPVQTVHETSVKAAKPLHQISLGEGAPEIYRSNIRYAYDERHECLVTFMFRYRPTETLIENGIALPSSNPIGNRPTSQLELWNQIITGGLPASAASSPTVARPHTVGPSPSLLYSRPQAHATQFDVPLGGPTKESKEKVQAELRIIEAEERRLMEQLESLRKRKRDDQQDEQTTLPAKMIKRESN